MMGHKYVFTEKMDKYPKIIPITLSYLEHCTANSSKEIPISHSDNRVIKPIITAGVLRIVENICL